MDKIIAYCGLTCSSCPAFLATQENNDDKRKEVAKMWSEMYKSDLKPGDINCYGCLSEGERIFNHCKVCDIRKCCREKGVADCAHCDDYACEKLGKFFEMAPDSKTSLEEIRKSL